jgi:hypothetical protein
MSVERNKALVRWIIEGLLNPGDPGLAEELLSPAESWDHFDALGLLGQSGARLRPEDPR